MLLTVANQPTLYIETLADQPRHFDKLFRLLERVQGFCEEASSQDLLINFNYCEFLGHSGVAFLGGLAQLVIARGGRVSFDWQTLQPKIYANLAQNGFLFEFGHPRPPRDGNSIPYRCDTGFDHRDIIDYLQYYWLGKGWVNISAPLQQAITGQTSEIYLNAFDHSQSAIGVFSCGQHYPKLGILQLTVLDFGIGIADCVRSLPQNQGLSTEQALAWAFESGNTTQQQPGVSRGLGLALLKDFIQRNRGSLLIYSNDGCLNIDDNGISYRDRLIDFSGTLVNISLRCDETVYTLDSDAAPQESWF
ncbi:MAG: ATP-binding protein [Cyanobacteria bacterium P01_D01_bin.44]